MIEDVKGLIAGYSADLKHKQNVLEQLKASNASNDKIIDLNARISELSNVISELSDIVYE